MKAEALVDVLADTPTEVDAKTLGNTLLKVKAEAVADALFNRPEKKWRWRQ